MYRYSNGQISLSDFKQPVGMNLKESNRWVKKAQTIPWLDIEKRYAKLFTNRKGNVAKPLRLALGACIIQAEYGFSDEETALMIQENPYLQYFCGYPGYDDEKLPFDPSLMVYFRKRLTPEVLGEINEMILRDAKERQEKGVEQKRNDDDDSTPPSDSGNSGTLIVDATCAPSNIRFPQDVLDELNALGCRPLMKISFDGIGYHDWLRNRESAEADALRAIRLCVDNGFRVKVQTNIHRLNMDAMLPTAKLLDSIGVNEMRIIRTTESPRWLQNAGDSCLTLKEYFDGMLQFLKEYAKTSCQMEIDIWQFVYFWQHGKVYRPRTMACGEGEYRDSLPVCRGNRGMVAVGANGNLYPCHQMSGYYEQHGWCLGNVKTDGLQKFLCEGSYLQTVCTTVKELKEHNEKCANYKWFRYCCGGCRAIGLALTEDVLGSDQSRCLFFEGGYMEKLKAALPECKNLAPFD